MDKKNEHLLLLIDAMDRAIANPMAGHYWDHLMAWARGISQQSVLDELVRLLLARVPGDGLAGFFRAMFLDIATDDAQYIAEAGRILLALEPVDPDRLGRFLYFAWQRALLHAKDRGSLMRGLQAAHLPAIAGLFGRHLGRHVPPGLRPRPVTRIRKVALVAPFLLTRQHPPTLMALDQFAVLTQQGLQVDLFSCQEPLGPEFDHLLGNGAYTPHQQVDLSGMHAGDGGHGRIHLGDPRFSLMRRSIDMLAEIAAFDPDIVVFVGLHTALMHALYAVRPVLGLCVNSIAPIVPTDVFLTAQKELAGQSSSPWGPVFAPAAAWYHPYRIRRKPAAPQGLQQDLNLPAGGVALVSVGSALNDKIGGEWAERMCCVLAQHPHVTWVLVGDAGELPTALRTAPAGQMRLIPRSNEVPAILAGCDIYVNPDSMGGGFAVAEAMAEGLPVLTYADSDGGDKVGDDAAATEAHYFAKLDGLIRDARLRRDLGGKMRARFNQELDLAQSGPSLLAACELALQRYRQRLGPA